MWAGSDCNESCEKCPIGQFFSKLFSTFFFLLFFRQIVARTVLETLRVVTGQSDDVTGVLNVMNKLADDVG